MASCGRRPITLRCARFSPAAGKSERVHREVDFALGSRRYADRLIPVVVKPTRDMPWILDELGPVSVKKAKGEVSRHVIEALQER